MTAVALPRSRAWLNRILERSDTNAPAGVRLLRAFERAYPHAFFVQVGSNDGEQHDPLRAAILRNDWHGIMIEPVPYVFDRLDMNYGAYADRIALENVAIGDRDGNVPFFHLAPVDDYEHAGLPQWYDGIGSFHREHVLKHVEHIPDIAARLVETSVPCLTFDALCARHGVTRVDLVHIDAEGSDLEVLRSIDLDRYRPRLVIFENYHLSADEREEANRHLRAHGFDTLDHGMDTWALSVAEDGSRDVRQLLDTWSMVRTDETDGRGGSTLRQLLVSQPQLRRLARKSYHAMKHFAEPPRRAAFDVLVDYTLANTTEHEWKMLTQAYDDTVPLPPGAETDLAADHPRLRELRASYSFVDTPATTTHVWSDTKLEQGLDLRYFRGDNPYVWHYREWPRAMVLKYFVFAEYVRTRDKHGLLTRLAEDGAFGCWTFDYAGLPRVSRDLLDSVNECSFLDRHLELLDRPHLRVLDIGAGYGRTAYAMARAASGLDDYCCVDAVPESTFLCEYYLRARGVTPPARVVALPDLDTALQPDHFDLAVNIHSFSECTYDAIAWWLQRVVALHIPDLFIVPNDGEEMLSFETDGTRRDFAPLLAAAGYHRTVCEPVIDDPAVRDLLRLHDRFLLFHRDV